MEVFVREGNSWVKLANTLKGTLSTGSVGTEVLGDVVDISSDGSRFATSVRRNSGKTVKVYQLNYDVWEPVGPEIIVDDINPSVLSISMSEDGERVAIGNSEGGEAGTARVFEWNNTEWEQLGNVLTGEDWGQWFGKALSISADGNRLAVGAHGYDENNENTGRTLVFDFDGENWILVGDPIIGDNIDESGFVVSLSANGDVLATGGTLGSAFRNDVVVFEWDGMAWIQRGEEIQIPGSKYKSISISEDGSRLAIGSGGYSELGYNMGIVTLLNWNGQEWKRVGEDLLGTIEDGYFGKVVSLSDDGNILAVRNNFNFSSEIELIKVFDYSVIEPKAKCKYIRIALEDNGLYSITPSMIDNGSTGLDISLSIDQNSFDCTHLGANTVVLTVTDVEGNTDSCTAEVSIVDFHELSDDTYDNGFGNAVSMSDDGNLIAVSGRGFAKVYEKTDCFWTQRGEDIVITTSFTSSKVTLSGDGDRLAISWPNHSSDRGRVETYEWDGLSWLAYGEPIIGEEEGDQFGTSIDLSDDGNILIIGSPQEDYTLSGYTRVFSWDGDAWSPLGERINGTSINKDLGEVVSISAEGNVIAIGDPYSDAGGNNSGEVIVYEFNGAEWVQKGNSLAGFNTIDSFGASLMLSSDGTRLVVGAPNNDA